MISGVEIYPLGVFEDRRGKVMHMVRDYDKYCPRLGEIYFSYVNSGCVKAWHLHRKMTLHYAVPNGEIILVLFDNRTDSPTRHEVMELRIGETNHKLVKIPPMIWNGFRSVLKGYGALVVNLADMPYDPREIVRQPPDSLKIGDKPVYDWGEYVYGG